MTAPSTARPWSNWAGNQQAHPVRLACPRDVDEVAATIAQAAERGQRVKAVGSGHSFTGLAATDGVMVDTSGLSGVREVDHTSGRIRVGGGTPLHVLTRTLAGHGLSMSNLGDIDRQTVAGAIATGTHGTGAAFGGLATQVRGLELVTGAGSVVWCDADTDRLLFAAARVSLGALGVLTEVELQCEPEFALHAEEQPLPLEEVLDGIHELADTNDHFEFFWFPHTEVALTKRNNRLADGQPRRPVGTYRAWLEDELFANTVFGWTCRLSRRWPHLTRRTNRFAARLLSARDYADTAHEVFVSPRRVKFVEAEYAVPREHVVEAFRRIRRIAEADDLDISFPVEVRFAAADDIPLSTAEGRETAYLAIHVFRGQPFTTYFERVEHALIELDPRPHWGKLHGFTAEQLRRTYPRFSDFVAARHRVDPQGRFSNAYVDRILGPMGGHPPAG